MEQELYDKDFYEWAMRNADLIRQGNLSEVDLENVAEELEAMGRSQKRELISRLSILIMHLLKWRYQSAKKGESCKKTIIEQRRELSLLIEDSPSLKHEVEESVARAYRLARNDFEDETGISGKNLPASCPYTFDQVTDRSFRPE